MKKFLSNLKNKRVVNILVVLAVSTLLIREGFKEYSRLVESGVLREVNHGKDEYSLGLGDVGSKHYEITTPENWTVYENETLSFSYPEQFRADDSKFGEVNKVRLIENNDKTTDLGSNLESEISIGANEGNMLPAASLHKQIFLRDWKMSGGLENITHMTRYSLNNRSVYHLAYRVDFNNYNPLRPTPFSDHWLFIQVDNRYYVLWASNLDLAKEDQFVENLLAIAASINNKGELQDPEHQLPLGLRKPKNVDEQLQLGSELLNFTSETQTFGDSNGDIMIIAFVSTLSAENYPAIIALSEYTSSHKSVGLRFETIPVVDSDLNQYSYYDAQLHCSLLKTNLVDLKSEISSPNDITVTDPGAVRSCLANPGLPAMIHEKSIKAIDFGVTDTPTVTVLYKGAWQGDYYGWDEIKELIEALDQITQARSS